MVTTYYPPYHFGGDGVFVQNLARALVRQGHHVEVIHCEDAYRLGAEHSQPDEDSPDGVIVHRLHSRWGVLSPLITQQLSIAGPKRSAIARILARGFDVVNFHNISLVGGLGALSMGHPALTVYTLHEHWLLCPTHIFWKNQQQACDKAECIRCCLRSGIPPQIWRYTAQRDRALAHVDLILSPSEYTARRHREGGIQAPIRVLPTYSGLAPDLSLPGPEPGARPRFLFVGRVTASKGIDHLVRVFTKLPQYDLDVAGTGDLLESLKREAARCPWIRFLGAVQRSELPTIYRRSIATILPSKAPEVFPLTILESLACGTPAIASEAGGSPEAILQSGAGFVYRDDEGLIAALRRIAEEPGLRASLSQRGRDAYKAAYTEERYLSEYLSLCREQLTP